MTEFEGFPAKMQFTPVPNLVFSSIFPGISNISELKVLFYIFELVYPKKGNLRYVSGKELTYRVGASGDKDLSAELIAAALKTLTEKGIILCLNIVKAERPEAIYFINTEANRLTISRIRSEEIEIPEYKQVQTVESIPAQNVDLFTLYEQNIGMLTPLIADELKEAQKLYPETWIKEAIKEAATLNKRNWRYIARILEHWSTEGKEDGTHRGNNKKNTDPDKYFRGKYGHIVRR
jgi:DNA replication protein